MFLRNAYDSAGCVNQKINYYIEKSPDKDIFVNARSIKLDKSYRSTYQIAKFCNDMLLDNLTLSILTAGK
jgi:DNA helicase IV